MPIVTYDMRNGTREIVDGFHRNRIAREYPDIQNRIQGYLPVTTLNKPLDQRIAATIRHNRARGTHGIRPMTPSSWISPAPAGPMKKYVPSWEWNWMRFFG